MFCFVLLRVTNLNILRGLYKKKSNLRNVMPNAVVTCEITLFQNHFSLRRRPSEVILPEIISKLFQMLTTYTWWIFSNMFNVDEIILK